jgi:hypothetical protein
VRRPSNFIGLALGLVFVLLGVAGFASSILQGDVLSALAMSSFFIALGGWVIQSTRRNLESDKGILDSTRSSRAVKAAGTVVVLAIPFLGILTIASHLLAIEGVFLLCYNALLIAFLCIPIVVAWHFVVSVVPRLRNSSEDREGA